MRQSQEKIYVSRKNDFVERSKILLDIDLEIIFLDHQKDVVEILKIMSCKKFWYFIN